MDDGRCDLAAGAEGLGLPVNERFEPGKQMDITCDPDDVLHVSPDADPEEFEAFMVQRHVGDQLARRDAFLDAISAHLAVAAGPTAGR